MPTFTAATVVLGMVQKAGLSNIYLFVVQSADYPDWGNVMLGSKWKLCQIGKPGSVEQETPFILHFQVKNMWCIYAVMGCKYAHENRITLHLAAARIKVRIQPAVVNVE